MQPDQSQSSFFLQPLTPNNFNILFYLSLSPITVIFALFPTAVLISLMTGYYPKLMSTLPLSGYLCLGYYVLALPILILLHALFRHFALLNMVSIFLSNVVIYFVLLITFEHHTLWLSSIWVILFSLFTTAFYQLFCYAEIGSDPFQ